MLQLTSSVSPRDRPSSAPVYLSYDCPSNLKEAIDWILRVTGKDGGNGGDQAIKALTNQVKELLESVKESDPGFKKDAFENVKNALDNGSGTGLIKSLAEGLQQFIGYDAGSNGKITGSGIAVGKDGQTGQKPWNSPSDASKGGYYLSYNPGQQGCEWDSSFNGNGNATTCARMFLSIIPLLWSALSYLYFMCSKKASDGGWKEMKIGGGPLKDFLYSMWFGPSRLQGTKNGKHVADSALQKFQELSSAKSEKSYAEFVKKLRENGVNQWKQESSGSSATTSYFLSGIYFLSQAYFQHQQSQRAKEALKPPSTIRQMLYFLATLQFSPQYDAFDSYVTEYFKTLTGQDNPKDHELALQVADSGTSDTGNTLSAADLKSHLLSTAIFIPGALGVIQGPGATEKSEPWLHSLFSNSQFNFNIPSSGAGIFGALSNYAYALQFQLHFLYQQCSNTYIKACGWNPCSYGSDINKSLGGKTFFTHICPTGCTTDGHSSGTHDKVPCEHNGCGKRPMKPSPLQAFLTDKLEGFSRRHPSDQSSHLATCSGYMCHVPMGFNPNDLRAAPGGNTQGSHISATLKPFCGGFNTPLRQLSEKLGCLTKRTPRTLGDMFGFTWHLNGQLFMGGKTADKALAEFFKSIGLDNYAGRIQITPLTFYNKVYAKIATLKPPSASNVIETALSLFPGLPFWYNLFMVKPDDSLPAVLFKVKNIPHQTANPPQYNGHHNDLYSLYNPVCTTQEKNCGPYLDPLTHSDGATYNPAHASIYLSWVLHLSDDLQSWFQDMLDEFKNTDCSKTGCMGTKCNSHAPGTHGISCNCDSVVHCGGTLPLLYRHGFRYYSPLELMRGSKDNTKRQCSDFATQLQSIVNGDPLSNLLTSIDDFLYAIRWEFFSKLSFFWTIYTGLILYTFFFLLDTLRLRSHLHFPSSNSIAPISLLTLGKAPALRTFTKLVYFIP
ncbi:variant erythrocyte surface antigen-1 family protein [Babesia caballi]|uniref:Variant erythrocyte surface antigen-1 family protein n=1 Tax=Babesia caballi TaxID=5871 RepID=A0AAV4LYV2_BABCB|nr:variant erythrocyte surface antigen-1 family protein [Babesia caballi]